MGFRQIGKTMGHYFGGERPNVRIIKPQALVVTRLRGYADALRADCELGFRKNPVFEQMGKIMERVPIRCVSVF
jgi:hypothetical protein